MNREDIEIIRNNLLFQVFEKADHDALTLKLIEEAFEEMLQLQKKTITEEEIEEAVKKREEEIRQWLIDEDYEGLAERL